MGAATVAVTDGNFESEIEKYKGVALVDFWATWCPPCVQLSPVVEQVAVDWSGKLKVAKIEVEQAEEISARFGVRSIPCLILFKNGAEIDRFVGYMVKSQLDSWIKNHVP